LKGEQKIKEKIFPGQKEGGFTIFPSPQPNFVVFFEPKFLVFWEALFKNPRGGVVGEI